MKIRLLEHPHTVGLVARGWYILGDHGSVLALTLAPSFVGRVVVPTLHRPTDTCFPLVLHLRMSQLVLKCLAQIIPGESLQNALPVLIGQILITVWPKKSSDEDLFLNHERAASCWFDVLH